MPLTGAVIHPPVTSKDSLESDFPTECCQLGPWESDILLDLSQALQWHFRVGATQIPAPLVPVGRKDTACGISKTSSAPGEARCPQQSLCQQ